MVIVFIRLSFHRILFFNWRKWVSIFITVNLEQSLARDAFGVGDTRRPGCSRKADCLFIAAAVHCNVSHNVCPTVNIFATDSVRTETLN